MRLAMGIGVLMSLMLVGLTAYALFLYNLLWLKPQRLRKKLQQQGINGPPPTFFYGNLLDIKEIRSDVAKSKPPQDGDNRILSHNYMPSMFPHLQKWRTEYGAQFVYSMGNMIMVYISDFEMVRQITQCKSIEFGRPSFLRKNRGALLGDSVITAIGTSWVHQRKVIAPEFFMKNVKGMVGMMTESAITMVKRWEDKIRAEGGIASIKVDKDLMNIAAEMISKVCFGSRYPQGNEICAKIRVILGLMSSQFAFLGLPGLRYVPIKSNREVWRISKEIKNSVLKLMEYHKQEGSEEDLLHVLMKNFSPDSGGVSNKNVQLVLDNIKAVFFGGHETTATTTTFTLMLLAHHPEWQKRVRDEVVDICAGQIPNADMLNKMKTLTMVIHETLRLYPGAPFSNRETAEEMKFGNYVIPKGVNIWVPVSTLHHDPEIWGEDAGEFKPERFANGISSACKLPNLYMPFGLGLRSCLGQNFAMTELKIILSLIILKFTLSLSPDYHHSIGYNIVLQPENGLYLLMELI